MTIQSLIDKQDTFEQVRDEIAAILAVESASQQALAVTAGKDPALWALKVYTERSNPFEALRADDNTPIVNVWYDSSDFEQGRSNIVERQLSSSVFNIDIYGRGEARENGAGHDAGDDLAAREAQRATRLVRNILMAAEYTYLNMRGVVGQRWPQNIKTFQPQLDNRNVTQVVATRIAFRVNFNEFSPQYEPQTLDLLSVQVERAEDGEIYINADYDYT